MMTAHVSSQEVVLSFETSVGQQLGLSVTGIYYCGE
jgi:hypothetical protein